MGFSSEMVELLRTLAYHEGPFDADLLRHSILDFEEMASASADTEDSISIFDETADPVAGVLVTDPDRSLLRVHRSPLISHRPMPISTPEEFALVHVEMAQLYAGLVGTFGRENLLDRVLTTQRAFSLATFYVFTLARLILCQHHAASISGPSGPAASTGTPSANNNLYTGSTTAATTLEAQVFVLGVGPARSEADRRAVEQELAAVHEELATTYNELVTMRAKLATTRGELAAT